MFLGNAVGAMLSTLLPGIRQLRAPLAAGYVWLIAAWIAFESRVPEEDEATGLAAALYRLNDAVSGFGLAVVASFAAYLIGSLSITLLAPSIRRQFVRTPRFTPSLGPLAPFSQHGISALTTLVRRTWDRMATTLALSGVSLDDVLELEVIRDEPRGSSALGKIAIRKPDRSPLRRVGERLFGRGSEIRIQGVTLSLDTGSALDTRRLQLVRTVVGEFDQIMRTRLLGRDPDLFAAVDRHRAEVEFRVALIPPLLVLAVAVASAVDLLFVPIVLFVGVLASLGLFWDALASERNANDTLAGALVDGRVLSPTLEALERRASTIAQQPQAEKMQQAGAEAARAIGELIDLLDRIDSNITQARTVADAVEELRDRTAPVEGFFSDAVVAERDRALAEIKQASKLWSEAFGSDTAGELMEQARGHARQAKEHYSAFRRAAVNEIEGRGAEPAPPPAEEPATQDAVPGAETTKGAAR
jgi:hypothetical protein